MGFVRGDAPKRPMARHDGGKEQRQRKRQQKQHEPAEAPGKQQQQQQQYPPPPPLPPAMTAAPPPAADGAFPPPPPLPPQQQQPLDDERSSRLCIKGLPAYVTEQRLREHLRAATRKDAADAAAALTDLKLLRTRGGGGGAGPAGAAAAAAARGASRGMAFVGFRSEADADAVRRYFDRTFLDASRLAVEFARKYRDDALPRPWSRHSEGSSRHAKLTGQAAAAAGGAAAAGADAPPAAAPAAKKPKKAGAAAPPEGSIAARAAADPALAEFLALMQPRARAKIWANDDALAAAMEQAHARRAAAGGGGGAATPATPAANPKKKRARGEEEEKAVFDDDGDEADEGGDDDELYQELGGVRGGGGGGGGGESGSDEEEEEDDDDDDDDEGGGGGEKDAAVVDEGVSDMDYLRSRMRKGALLADDDDAEEENEGQAGVDKSDEEEEEEDDDDDDDDEALPSSSEEESAGAHAADPSSGSGDSSSGDDDDDDDDPVAAAERSLRREARRRARVEEERVAAGELGPPGASFAARAPGADAADDADADADPDALALETGRLFVRNLPFSATEADLRAAFSPHGALSAVHLVLADRRTAAAAAAGAGAAGSAAAPLLRPSRGVAFVEFVVPEDAVRARRALDGSIFMGRLLHVLGARPPPAAEAAAAAARDGDEQQGDRAPPPGTSSYKEERDAALRASAQTNRAAWNALFLRQDAVAEAVAAHYGVSKSQLMDGRGDGPDGGAASLAARLALGEAQVLAATKSALLADGVDVGALERAAAAAGKGGAAAAAAGGKRGVARSDSAILVKNLPFGTDERELRELLETRGGGPLLRLSLPPPTRALAVAEFAQPQDARAAFRALAYRQFRRAPLYLEWAPAGVFFEPGSATAKEAAAQAAAERAARAAVEAAADAAAGRGGGAAAVDPTVAAATALARGEGQEAAARAARAAVRAALPAVAGEEEEEEDQLQQQRGKRAAGGASARGDDGDDGDGGGGGGGGGPTASIYVKNLSFATTDAAFRQHFERAAAAAGARLLSARVARKQAPEPKGAKAKKAAKAAAAAGAPPAAPLSMGYGFVELDSAAAARAVMRAVQGAKLDGHDLRLALSQAKGAAGGGSGAAGKDAERAAKAAAKKAAAAADDDDNDDDGSVAAPTKLVVRNVAFEATRRDIAALFASFGHARSVRLPQKPNGSHRGFAFVEYATPKEAVAAAAGVAGAHLYGRRLVVEFASSAGGETGGEGFAGGGNATGEGLRAVAAKTAARSRAALPRGGGGGGSEEYADAEGDGEAARSVRVARRLQRTL